MQRDQLVELFDTAVAADATCTDRSVVVSAIAAVTRIAAWCDSQQIAYAQALDAMGAVPEDVMAKASRSDSRDVERIVKRADTAKKAPAFGKALAAGKVAAGHLDQLGNSLRRLDGEQQASLLGEAARLVGIAAPSTPDEFGRTLRAEERRLATDDGMSRLQRQRAAVRLHRRTDMQSGMNVFTLTVDPVTGLMLHNKISAATHHTPGQSRTTTCATRCLRDLRDPRLRRPFRSVQDPPRSLVAARRAHRSVQPATDLRETSHARAHGRLGTASRRRPHTDHHSPRQHNHDHRPASKTRCVSAGQSTFVSRRWLL